MRRRAVAALLAGLAVWVGVATLETPAERLAPVVVAARDLEAGTVLDARSLTVREFLPGTAPASAATDARDWWGRRVAVPLAAGEPLTPARLLGSEQRRAWPGLTTVPVRLGDEEAADLLRAGDRVDLLATDPRTGGSSTLARDVPVVSVVTASSGASARSPTGSGTGRLVLLAVAPALVESVVAAGSSRYLAFTFAG